MLCIYKFMFDIDITLCSKWINFLNFCMYVAIECGNTYNYAWSKHCCLNTILLINVLQFSFILYNFVIEKLYSRIASNGIQLLTVILAIICHLYHGLATADKIVFLITCVYYAGLAVSRWSVVFGPTCLLAGLWENIYTCHHNTL